MLTKTFTTTDDTGRTVRIEPTGEVLRYCGRDCQQFRHYTEHEGYDYQGASFFAPVRATQRQVLDQLGY